MFKSYQVKNISLPDNFNWLEEEPECIHPVMNQGDCGSCWAFSASEVVSDRVCIATKK